MEKENVYYPPEIDEVRRLGEEAEEMEKNIRTVYNFMADNNVLSTAVGELTKESMKRILYKISRLKNKAEVMKIYSENQGWVDSIDFLYSKDLDEFREDVKKAEEDLNIIRAVYESATDEIVRRKLRKLGEELKNVQWRLDWKKIEVGEGSKEFSNIHCCYSVPVYGAIKGINELSRERLNTPEASKKIEDWLGILKTCKEYLESDEALF